MAIEAELVEASDCGSEETGSNPVYRPIFPCCPVCNFSIVNTVYVVDNNGILTHTKCFLDAEGP